MKHTPNQKRALNLHKHICVTAGAGSGKTTVLVNRYLEILRQDNIKPEQVVAITFTDKAAAEMKSRIIEELNKQDNSEIRSRHIEQMKTAPISTIHSFCGNILREFPFQAGVPANFNIIQGIDQKRLLNQTIQDNLRDIASDPDHKLYKTLSLSLKRYGNRTKILKLFSTLIEKREIIDPLIENVYTNRCKKDIPEVWREFFLDQLPSETEIDEFIKSLHQVLIIAKGKNTSVVENLVSKLEILPDKMPSSPDVLAILNEIIALIANKNGSVNKPQFLGNKTDTSTIDSDIDTLINVITKIQSAPSIDNDDTDTDNLFLFKTTKHLLDLYKGIRNDYQNTKLTQGKLDFTDLQLKTRDLLRSNEQIRNQLYERHNFYMIDEFQDTNEIQYELVMLLTNHLQDANLFIVGDPKQSIFGFRGADVRIFNKTRKKIEENGGENIYLKENFRSLRNPMGFVNHFFKNLMGDGTQSEYDVPFEALTKARDDDKDGNIEILLGNNGEDGISEYKLIAHHINNLVTDGLNYEDIAILIRSRSHLPDLEEALLREGIPYLTTGGIGFYQRQEIYDIWNYLHFLNNPENNDTSLIGILRGPAFGISDSELYEISLQSGESFCEKAYSFHTQSMELLRAKDILKNQIQFAHRMPVNLLIQKIVNETGLIGTINIGKQGQQKSANYQKLLELARQYDSESNQHTLSDFIEFLNYLITEEPREGQAQIENTSGSVEIMTVHSAKGKQFPVVILPCLHRRGAQSSEPFLDGKVGIGFSPYKPAENYEKSEPEILDLIKAHAKDKDEAEKKRLFYVAATRAKDRLVLSGALNSNGKIENMLNWLYEHLGINKEDGYVNIDINVHEYSDQETTSRQVMLHIPIINRITSSLDEESSLDEGQIKSPEYPIQSLNQNSVKTSFSVTELVNYFHCPLRYKLEHVLRVSTLVNNQIDRNEAELDRIIRNVLLQLRYRQDKHNINRIINQTIENYSEFNFNSSTTDLVDIIMNHVMNYSNSEISELVLSSSERNNNHYIHANINGHIISAKIDGLFKDQSGHWQGINFITNNMNLLEYYEPEMELIGLLIHQSYPDQQNVSVNYFNTKSNELHTECYNIADFQSISNNLQESVNLLQQENYQKNLSHCGSCQYSNSHGMCIVD